LSLFGFITNLFRPAQWPSFLALGAATVPIQVNDLSAQESKTLSAVYAASSAYSSGISPLSLDVCAKDKEHTPNPKHPLAATLRDLDDEMNAQQVKAFWVDSLNLKGNAYGHIRRDGGGRARLISPIDADFVTPARKNGSIIYRVVNGNGQTRTEPAVIPAADMIHVHINYNPRTLRGMGVPGFARTSISLGLAQENFGLQFFTSGPTPRLILEMAGTPTEDQKQQFKTQWEASAGKNAIIGGSVKVHQVTIPLEDSQFLESRQFTVNEIARWFNLPASRIGGTRASGTYANLAQDQLAFINHSLSPMARMFEAEFDRKLLTPDERAEVGTRFNTDELMEQVTAMEEKATLALASQPAIAD
jgi:HK97 family phage portal protein